VLAHNGCDGWCYALVVIVPADNFAVCMATNYGGPEARDACNKELRGLLVRRAKEMKRKGGAR
jgi:hypothetical protein